MVKQIDDIDTYALRREEAGKSHGAGWWVSLRRRGRKIIRLFKDSIYGSSEASFRQAKAYRDAVISALPPPTNHEQAVLLRKNNTSGISGVRRIETREGDAWQATLMTKEGQKRENFSVSKFGEEVAKSMAITQRRKWLKDLPVKHLAYAHHAEEINREHFADQLAPVSDVMPAVTMSEEEVEWLLEAIDRRFDEMRPRRLRVRVKSYAKNKLTIAVSDAGQPAKRRMVQLNTSSLTETQIIKAARERVEAEIALVHDKATASWFMAEHASSLFAPERFDSAVGFNVLVCVPT
ncbi:hypothetical protein [Oryzifoliimicrobium ureilyticus]|uniref:hypothetical protein n=1 Tax=Oryzifoliimicrobium ureilyticus TaxID=3113724 RepID=UPI00307617CD